MDWQELAERMGPQSAAYRYSEDWDGHLRTIVCPCGALIEIFDEDAPPHGEYLCDDCTRRHVAMIEDVGKGAHTDGDR